MDLEALGVEAEVKNRSSCSNGSKRSSRLPIWEFDVLNCLNDWNDLNQ